MTSHQKSLAVTASESHHTQIILALPNSACGLANIESTTIEEYDVIF